MSAATVVYCENNVDGTIGGSYFSLLYLIRGLDRTKYDPIVVFYTDHRLLQAFKDAGAETQIWKRARPFTFGKAAGRVAPAAAKALLPVQKALNIGWTFLWPALVRALFLLRRRVRLVHLNNSILYNHDWMLAARLTGTACLTHERGINERYPRLARYFARNLDAVICISEAVHQRMTERGADFGNLITIHNGLDPAAVTSAPSDLRLSYGIPPDAPVVGMVGNIKAWKGQDTLIRAMARVGGGLTGVRCVFIGDTSPADQEYADGLRALVRSLNLEAQILFTGFKANVAEHMMMCDVIVHASVLPEPFGRVILEAMACRKPVIGARAGGIPEIIDEGVTGITFRPGDPESLSDALETVLKDPLAARRMGAAGYDRLIREFHIDRNVEATQGVYEDVLGAH